MLTDEKMWFIQKDSPTDIPEDRVSEYAHYKYHAEQRTSFGSSHYPRMHSMQVAEMIMKEITVKALQENVEALIKRRKENDDTV